MPRAGDVWVYVAIDQLSDCEFWISDVGCGEHR